MMTVTGSTVDRHDTIGGACSKESNALRYGFHTMAQHACVENFLHEMGRHGLDKRDLQSNINWFMNVPVDPDGTLGIVDGISAPGLWVEVQGRARRAGGRVELPADQQPLQRLRPHPRPDGRDLGNDGRTGRRQERRRDRRQERADDLDHAGAPRPTSRREVADAADLPLAGLRLGVKDNIDVAGLPDHRRLPGLRLRPGASAPVVARLVEPRARWWSARPTSTSSPPAWSAPAAPTGWSRARWRPATSPAARPAGRPWPWPSARSTPPSAPTPPAPAGCRPPSAASSA